MNSELLPALRDAAKSKGVTLLEGKGNDKDTLGKKIVWVMDTQSFPFYQAEIYHQFHGKNEQQRAALTTHHRKLLSPPILCHACLQKSNNFLASCHLKFQERSKENYFISFTRTASPDGFMPGEQYPQSYNSLARGAVADGRIGRTGCPE